MTVEPIELLAAQRAKPRVGRDGMGYIWEMPESGVCMRVDYLTGRGDELHGEIAVTLRGEHLHLARFNLSSSTSRGTLQKALVGQTDGMEIPWQRLVEQFCVAVLRKEREGEPTRYPSQAARKPTQYLIENLVIKNKTNLLFAPGGSGKGYLTIGLCCGAAAKRAIAGLTVMPAQPFYLDWEDDFDTFEQRLNAVARGLGVEVPRIPYRRMRGLLSDRVNEVARAVADEGADFVVVDSFSAAGGTISERTSWDSIAHRLFDAIDMIPGVTWLIIDHVTGDKLKDPSGKAYGSIQKMNRARNAWEMRSDQEPGSPTSHMRLFDAKWNHTGRRKPLGVCLNFEGDKVTFSAEDPATSAHGGEATLPDRMAIELEAGALSTGVLAQALHVDAAAIRSELSRNAGRFQRDDKGFITLRRIYAVDAASEEREPLPW